MEPEKLEEYKDATGIALLNAYSNGLLSRAEYQLIQRFKRERWDDAETFLKSALEYEGKESTKTVESSKNEASKFVPSEGTVIVESSKNEASKYVESTKIVHSMLDSRKSLLNRLQTPLEQSIYNRLYRLSVGWRRNYCRVSSKVLLTACNIKDRRTLNAGLDGLIRKGHIQAINRNNQGVLYRIFFPREILGNDSNTHIEMIPVTKSVKIEDIDIEDTKTVDSTNNEDSTKNEDSTESPPFKDIYKDNIKDTLSPRAIISGFYNKIGQTKISKEKRERAEMDFKELLKDSFGPEDIQFAVEWTVGNAKEKLYDFSIIKHTIGQAMAVKKKTEAEEAKRMEAERIAAQQRAEEELREREAAKIEAFKESLGAEERAKLRERAEAEIRNSEQYKEEFITGYLIEAMENDLIRERIGMKLSE